MVFQNLNENFIDIFHRLDDFLFTSTRLSNPVLRCFCTIGNFINSSHDSLKMTPQHTAYVVLSPVTSFHCFDGCISSSIFLIQSIKICFHLFFNFFRIFCAQHQIRFLITCNSFQPALYMVTEILEIIYLLFLSKEELINLLKDAGIIYILSKEQKESKIDTIENECKLVVCAPKGEFVSSMTEDEAKGYTRIIRKAANLNEDDDFYFSCKVKYIGFKLLNVPFDFIHEYELIYFGDSTFINGTHLENMQLFDSKKAYLRGIGYKHLQLKINDFVNLISAVNWVWKCVEESEIVSSGNIFIFLGYGRHYHFHKDYLLAFSNTWMFIE